MLDFNNIQYTQVLNIRRCRDSRTI